MLDWARHLWWTVWLPISWPRARASRHHAELHASVDHLLASVSGKPARSLDPPVRYCAPITFNTSAACCLVEAL